MSSIIGRSSCGFRSPKGQAESLEWRKAVQTFPEFNKYGWPRRDATAEKTSFKLQCDSFIDSAPPSKQDREDALDRVIPHYVHHTLPAYLHQYNRRDWNVALENIKLLIKADSSPGSPYALEATRNDQLMSRMGVEFNELVLDRIERRLKLSNEEIAAMSRQQRIDYGLCDPVRVFVKNEPHKKTKLQEGRFRLIMSVSIIDKAIEMLLNAPLHKLEIANWARIPSKPGIGFTKEDNQSVYNDIMSHGNMAFADINKWDWSCKYWLMEDCVAAKIRLCTNPSPDWIKLVKLEPIIESESVYQFSDGLMVAPHYRGIVNSGKYKTSRDNSFMRVLLAFMIGADKAIAAGDDTVESFVAGAEARYEQLGWKLKDYQRVGKGFEFCSRWYENGVSFPLNAGKMLMNFLHTKFKTAFEYEMQLMQLTDQLEYHPDFPKIADFIESLNLSPVSRRGSNNLK